MSSGSTEQDASPSKAMQKTFLSIFIALITVGGTVGGFLIGRATDHDSYVKKVSTLLATENNLTTLYQIIGQQIDNPETAQALAKLYDVRDGDRSALVKQLRDVAWVPAYRPAPFVGHMAKPLLGEDPHINILGFRDERQNYVTKPDGTVRIFLTGGSTAWGSGASSQKKTISCILEQILNERVAPTTGYRYEVVNTAFPAWTTTQERLLIEQRLVDMHPDVVLMLSGNNDVHWTRDGRDIRWFYSPMDDNHMMLLNELYKSSGHSDWTFAVPASSRPIECSELARITARNVEGAAIATDRVKARLIFALQPNVATSAKPLTKREQYLPEVRNRPYWDSCYQALRDALTISARNYRFIDLSRSFGDIDNSTEVFVDSYHFADLGNRLIAQALAREIDWQAIIPGPSVTADSTEPLKIVKFDPVEYASGKPFNPQADGTSAIRVIPGSINKNLLVVFDQSVLPTVVAKDAITASMPPSLYATKGEHRIYIVDAMTGMASSPVVFHAR